MTRRQRFRALLDSARTIAQGWAHLEVWFYNLDNYRPDWQVARELKAIAATRPAVIAVCEVIGNSLPDLAGYRLIASTTSRSRENIAAYVRDGLPLRNTHWLDLAETWSRTKGSGTHEARSYLLLAIGWFQVAVAHQPPKGTDNTRKAQQEGVDALVRAMAPWTRDGWSDLRWVERRVQRLRPRLLVLDGNRRAGDPGPGPDDVARRIGGKVYLGHLIDQALGRKVKVKGARKVRRVNGVNLQSDHGGAIRVVVRIHRMWLAGPSTS